jgi:hypothetical protein
MRKLSVVLALSLFCAAVVCAQRKQTDREFEGLKGPVKSVSVEKAVLKEQEGRQVEERRVMVESATYNVNGNRVNDARYDSGGDLLVKNVYRDADAGKVVDTYVRLPLITAEMAEAGSGGTVRPDRPPKTGPPLLQRGPEKYKYKYDDRGNIREMSIEYKGRVRRRVVYNLKEGRKELLSYEDGKDLDYQRVETLDAQGNVIESTVADTVLSDQKHSYTAYEFDARGNWVKRVKSEWTTEGGKPRFVPVQVEYRTIVYF